MQNLNGGPTQGPESAQQPANMREEPMLELLAEGATSIGQAKANTDHPTNILSLGEDPLSDDLDEYLNFSMDDFPMPEKNAPLFSEPLSGEGLEPEPKQGSAPEPSGTKPPKKGLREKLREKLKGLLSYRLTMIRTGKETEQGSLVEADQGEKAPPAPKKKKPKKQKAEKKKPAKSKPPKVKAPKKGAKKDGAEKKAFGKKPLIFAALGVVVLAAGISAGVFFLKGGKEPEKLMEKAHSYMAEGEYDKAISVFEQIIEANELLPEAYLGMADSLVASDDREGALRRLSMGYQETEDARLSQRMEELNQQREDGEDGEAPAAPRQPIEWSDAAFERMVRLALEMPEGPIHEADLAGVTSLKILGSEYASIKGDLHAINGVDGYTIGGETFTERGSITSLDDVVYFKNLTRLTVGYNQVRDLSALGAMSLSTISLYANDITDISPLGEVDSLRFLYLYNNHITDISPLARQTGLISLSLQHNQISDLAPLAGLSQLQELYISDNLVESLAPLSNLNHLAFLDARRNNISDLRPVAGLASLTDASFAGNPVADYSPAAFVQNLNQSFGRTG